MKTYSLKEKEIRRNWHLLDAKGKILGRLATQAALWLMGKHKPSYTPNLDNGDYVVVINAAQVLVSGRKYEKKMYRHHTGHLGNLKELSFKQMMAKDPRQVIISAVRGMLPKNKLRKQRLQRLKVFPQADHPYAGKFEGKK